MFWIINEFIYYFITIYFKRSLLFDFQAVEEEKALYERSTRRQVYLNLCVNAIKKLRDTIQLELPSPVKTETATQVAVTKTLSSGAVLISTKSPAKQDKPALPATDQLTGEYADLFK